MNTVRLPSPIVDDLLRQASRSPGEEICGLISRDRDGFRKCYPVPNRAEDRKHFFQLDPRMQIDALRTMRERGEELAAIYHSHPDTPAYPSATDVAQHEYPGALYLIISLATPDKPDLRGFHIRDRIIEEVAIEVEAGRSR